MRPKTNRRSYGTGSLLITRHADGTGVYYGKFRDQAGQQVKRRIGPVRTPHEPDGLTKAQAEARLRDLIATVQAAAPVEHARTLAPRRRSVDGAPRGHRDESVDGPRLPGGARQMVPANPRRTLTGPHHGGRRRARHGPDAQASYVKQSVVGTRSGSWSR